MSNLPQIFNYQDKQVRTIVVDGEPWFVAKDVCEVLDLTNPTIVLGRLEVDEVTKFNLGGLSGETNIVNEYGLYNLVLGSRKPEAKQFKRWVTHEVIPSIRKTGSYSLQDPQRLIAAALVEAQKLLEAKDQQLAIMKPKAEFFDQVASSKDAIDIGTAAKVLHLGIGRNKLFEILRQEGVLMSNNQPYQKYIDCGYFRTIEQKYNKPDGSVNINIKTLVYQKGLNFIKKLVEEKYLVRG